MRHASLFDETFDPGQASAYDLLLAPHRHGIDVAVHDGLRRRFIVYHEHRFRISDDTEWRAAFQSLLAAQPWLAARFRSVKVGWRGRCYTVLPKEFFVPAEAKLLLNRLSRVGEYDTLYYNRVTEDVLLLFAIPSELINALIHTFSHFTVLHQETTLLRLGLQQFRRVTCAVMHLSQEYVTASLFQSGQLLKHTAFDALMPADILYYVAALLNPVEAAFVKPKKGRKGAAAATYKLVGQGVRLESLSVKEEHWLLSTAVEPLVEEYYPRYEHSLLPPGHSFAYSLEPYREAAAGLFSLILYS